MRRALYTKDSYRRFFQRVKCATARQVRLYFTGSEKRHKRTEDLLPKFVRNRELVAVSHEGELVYFALRYCKGKNFFERIPHDVACTELQIRLWWADRSGTIVPEREFFGFGSVADGGMMYEKSMLLYELHTADNFYRHKPETKVAQYSHNLPTIEKHFQRVALVIFVIDAPAAEVLEMARRCSNEKCFFTDYETFKSVPIGQQLTAPIFIWGGDGQAYPLRK